MKNEISRSVEKNKVIIRYDDGTEKIVTIPSEVPENILVDADPQIDGGHSFDKKDLDQRGYND